MGLVAGTNFEAKIVRPHDRTCLRDLLQELVPNVAKVAQSMTISLHFAVNACSVQFITLNVAIMTVKRTTTTRQNSPAQGIRRRQ